MHHDPQFYRIRNYLVDFLVRRSKELSATHGDRPDTGRVAAAATRLVYPGLDDGAAAPVAVARAAGPNLKAIA
jgi:nitrate/nitrite transport system ATP-binding protein